jgi:arsenate reductase-like glutaredoxin family protein
MAKVKYTDNEVRVFMETAKEIGIGPAMRGLQYPSSWSTAQRWFETAGVELPTVSALATKAASMKQFYNDKEKLTVAQAELDRIVEKLDKDELSADDLNKLANALHKTVQAINLIEGKSTTITESRQKDGTDLAITDMLNEAKAKNALIEQGIESN